MWSALTSRSRSGLCFACGLIRTSYRRTSSTGTLAFGSLGACCGTHGAHATLIGVKWAT